MDTSVTEITRHFAAPRERIYRALTDPTDVARWRFPVGMTCQVHEFNAVEGGRLRVSLTYESEERAGKSTGRTDTYRGTFTALVPGTLLVEVDEFETADPLMAGPMTMTIRLSDTEDGGTRLVATHAGVPAGVSAADNEAGWRQALDRLAELVEEPRGAG